jgi:hypothetical protein
VGSTIDADPERAKVWADEWTVGPFDLSGATKHLDVAAYRHPQVRTIATIPLIGPARP